MVLEGEREKSLQVPYRKEIRQMIFEASFSYRHCEKCEKYIDDGSYKNGKYLCHDCLDNEE